MEHNRKLVFHPLCVLCGNKRSYLLSVLGRLLRAGEGHEQYSTSSTRPCVKEIIYLFISASAMLQVLQGNRDEAAAQQPLENYLEPGTHQALSFQKKSAYRGQTLALSQELLPMSGRLTLINTCTLTVTKFLSSAKKV